MIFLDPREPVNTWSHAAGLLLALFGILLLWRLSRGDPVRRLVLMIYGLSLASCYAASTLYHGLNLPPERLAAWDRLDRAGIFVLIAGTYTPLVWGLLRGRWRWGTLLSVWLVATVASAFLALGVPLPTSVGTALYLGMGWGSIFCYAELARAVSHRALRPLVIGGLFYSVGAIVNLFGWPVLWPGVFGPHELFHLFVIAGSLSHFWMIWKLVGTPGPKPRRTLHGSAPGTSDVASPHPPATERSPVA